MLMTQKEGLNKYEQGLKNKKIVLIGPPETGKTTIKKVYFELVNPLSLLEKKLEPTRGVEIDVYKLFNLNLGVFDVSGQEFKYISEKEKFLFKNTDLILVVFDNNQKLDEIGRFLEKTFNITKTQCQNAKIVVFFHKLDSYPKHLLIKRISLLKNYIKIHYPEFADIKYYGTSIHERYFLKTYGIIRNIIFGLVETNDELFNVSDKELYEIDLIERIILTYDPDVFFSLNDLLYKFNLGKDFIKKIIKTMSDKNLITLGVDGKWTYLFRNRPDHNKIKNQPQSQTKKISQILSPIPDGNDKAKKAYEFISHGLKLTKIPLNKKINENDNSTPADNINNDTNNNSNNGTNNNSNNGINNNSNNGINNNSNNGTNNNSNNGINNELETDIMNDSLEDKFDWEYYQQIADMEKFRFIYPSDINKYPLDALFFRLSNKAKRIRKQLELIRIKCLSNDEQDENAVHNHDGAINIPTKNDENVDTFSSIKNNGSDYVGNLLNLGNESELNLKNIKGSKVALPLKDRISIFYYMMNLKKR
ncbi:MAG: ADP-ribosylation factor-like protein [Promethearchaeota archaeon]